MRGMPELPLVVLVHGAWHGAWCWAGVQAELDGRGVPTLAVDLPGHGASTLPFTDLAGDAAHVADVVARAGRPVVLVGHSYGGAVIGEAGGPGDVRALVFVAAFCLDSGESVARQTDVSYPPTLAAAATVRAEGLLTIDPAQATASFYAECPSPAAEAAVARLGPQPVATFVQPATVAAWHDRPSTYVLCSRDNAIHPLHQAAMSERCGEVVTLDADHSPFTSATTAVVDVIERVTRAAAASAP
jgi:pimeloyl-ACP methyl ester carboxylesterase